MLRALLLTTLTLSFAADAAADTALARCAGIDVDARRLACYDAVAGRAAAVPTADAEPADSSPATRFGAEQLPPAAAADPDEPDRIESLLTGHFEGWHKDSVFELDNGQVWRCVDCREVYYVREQPKVTISRGFFGGYWLKVEGLNQQARVRRIK